MALQKLGKYEIVSEIGRGAMGVVYKAFDPLLEREVALKTMMASMGGMDQESKARFYREARSAAKLAHRNIVTIFDMGEEQGIPYIAMEFLDGIDLHRKMKRDGPLPLRESLDITAQILHGLHYAHQFQIVHRDVKPANVYILKSGTAKILDFGIAKLATSEMTRTGMVLGTVDYMSPEQIRADKGVDGRSDLFSAGVILYELLSSRKPFPGETITQIMFKIVHDPPQDLPRERDLPQRLVDICRRALDKDNARRFQTGDEFAGEIESVIKQMDAELTTVMQMSPDGLDTTARLSTARRLYESGEFDRSALLLGEVLRQEPGNREAAQLMTMVGKRQGTEQTMMLEPQGDEPPPSSPRASTIEEILAEIEEERKTSPGAAGRSEAARPDLTMRLEDSGARGAVKQPPAVAPPAPPPPSAAKPAAEPPAPRETPRAVAERPTAEIGPEEAAAKRGKAGGKPAAAPSAVKEPAPLPAKEEKKAKGYVPPKAPVAPARPAPAAEAHPPARADRGAEPSRRSPALLAGGGIAVVAILGIALWLVLGRGGGTKPSATGTAPSPSTASSPAPAKPAGTPPAAAPAGAAGYLAIDAQPWAEVASIRDAASGKMMTLPSEGGAGVTTPIVIDLPPGRYDVLLKHPQYPEVTARGIAVTSGQWTRVNETMPGFSYKPKAPAAP